MIFNQKLTIQVNKMLKSVRYRCRRHEETV